MKFSERLSQKIKIDSLAAAVNASTSPPGGGGSIDKDAMIELLGMLPFERVEQRDVVMYVMNRDAKDSQILVLDNELAIYRGTTIDDVVMRKNPIVNEMVKVRNIIKILSDKDVVASRRKDSVAVIRDLIMEDIDLTFNADDIEAIRKTAVRSVEFDHSQGIREGVSLFSELLDFIDHPFAKRQSLLTAKGAPDKTKGHAPLFGPAVIYVHSDHRVLWLENVLDASRKEDKKLFEAVAQGVRKPTAQGADVFDLLAEMTIEKYYLAQGGKADLKNNLS